MLKTKVKYLLLCLLVFNLCTGCAIIDDALYDHVQTSDYIEVTPSGQITSWKDDGYFTTEAAEYNIIVISDMNKWDSDEPCYQIIKTDKGYDLYISEHNTKLYPAHLLE